MSVEYFLHGHFFPRKLLDSESGADSEFELLMKEIKLLSDAQKIF